MDIASTPAKMMKHRLQMLGLPGKVIRGSVLRSPIQSESFDCFVSIGCFHHTGDVQKCVDEAYRILKPGGKAFIMVYNQYSYRQWFSWPKDTFRALLRDLGFLNERSLQASEGQRKAYDTDLAGRVAPETVFLSIRQLHTMFGQYSHISFQKENCTDLSLLRLRLIPRRTLLPFLGRTLGLDIYIQAKK
jgi:SAM-dependent methyltransferase